MAKSKQDYIDLGKADGLKGVETNKPKSGWQLVSYTAGWEDGCDEAALAKDRLAAYQVRVKAPLFTKKPDEVPTAQRRIHRDAQRRLDATIAKLTDKAQRRRMRVQGAARRVAFG